MPSLVSGGSAGGDGSSDDDVDDNDDDYHTHHNSMMSSSGGGGGGGGGGSGSGRRGLENDFDDDSSVGRGKYNLHIFKLFCFVLFRFVFFFPRERWFFNFYGEFMSEICFFFFLLSLLFIFVT